MEEKILSVLSKDKWIPTTKISILINNSYYKVQMILESLLKDKKVEKKEEGRGIYWRLKHE